jgi:hypothetical protein
MKAIAVTLLILASVLTIHLALSASTPARPAGVEDRDWIPVSDKMGFVVTTSQIGVTTVDRQPLLLMPPAEGYFIVHTGNV